MSVDFITILPTAPRVGNERGQMSQRGDIPFLVVMDKADDYPSGGRKNLPWAQLIMRTL